VDAAALLLLLLLLLTARVVACARGYTVTRLCCALTWLPE